MDELDKAQRKRGRPCAPRSPEYKYPAGITEAPTLAQVEALRQALIASYGARLPAEQMAALAEYLQHAMGYYNAARAWREKQNPRKQGNKHKQPEQMLLIDCARAWHRATGRKAALWVDDKDKGAYVSDAVSLAKIVMEVATGRKFLQSLRRQVKTARKNYGYRLRKQLSVKRKFRRFFMPSGCARISWA
jgi:hypothetical protein